MRVVPSRLELGSKRTERPTIVVTQDIVIYN